MIGTGQCSRGLEIGDIADTNDESELRFAHEIGRAATGIDPRRPARRLSFMTGWSTEES